MPLFPSVLLVEDDRGIAGALVQALSGNYQVDVVSTGRAAVCKMDNYSYSLVILDLNLPDVSGLTVCQQMRARGQSTPILILTAEAGVLTKIKLLDAGADDYLTKPFSLGELKARLRVLARAASPIEPVSDRRLTACGLILDLSNYTVSRNGVVIKLRRKEFALLECLVRHAGLVVSRLALSRFAWQSDEKLWTNTIEVHIKHLRDKLDKPFSTQLIKTVHGMGYKLDPEPPACEASELAK